TTSGQQSHPTNFRNANLAQACATAREALVALAAARLRVPLDRLTVKDGVVGAADDPTQHVTYGELIGGRNFNLTISGTAKRKHPSQWTVLGSSVGRLDLPALVTGQAEFVHNVGVPGVGDGRA